jgi:hypothetical protein
MQRAASARALEDAKALGVIITIVYYFHLFMVINSLLVFDCQTPDGSEPVLEAEPSVVCGSAVHWGMQVSGAIGLILFGVGVPVWFGTVLFRYRDVISRDQALRAKGEGWSEVSNQHILFRLKWQRLYRDFKPQAMWWRLVVLARKTAMAMVVLWFNHAPMTQLPLMILILAIAGASHLKFRPYVDTLHVSDVFEKARSKAASLDMARARRQSTVTHATKSQSLPNRIRVNYNSLETFSMLISLIVLLFAMAFKSAADIILARRILMDDSLPASEKDEMLKDIDSVQLVSRVDIMRGGNPLGNEPGRSLAAVFMIVCAVIGTLTFVGVVCWEVSQSFRSMRTVLKARELEETAAVLSSPDAFVDKVMSSGAAVSNPLYAAKARASGRGGMG